MDKLSQDILLHQFLQHLSKIIVMDLHEIEKLKAGGNKNFNILIKEENIKKSLKELNKIGNDHVFDLIDQIRDKYKVELTSFERPKEKK